MKNSILKTMITFISIILLINIGGIVYAESPIDINVVDNLFDNILKLLNIIMVILNFLFVIFVFYNEKKQNKENAIKEYNDYWYTKFIIDNNIKILDIFFNSLNHLIKDVANNIIRRNNGEINLDILSYTRIIFSKWTNMHNECKSMFCEKIDVVMPEFSRNLRNDFLFLQDLVTNKLNEIILCEDNSRIEINKSEILDKLSESKKSFIKKLYFYGKPT